MQVDSSALDSRYPVVLGSPIHSPFYASNAKEDDAAFRLQRTAKESLSLVEPRQPESCLDQSLLHFSISIPYHPSIIFVEYCELLVNVLLHPATYT